VAFGKQAVGFTPDAKEAEQLLMAVFGQIQVVEKDFSPCKA
jgi:hypothetical protein